MPHSFGLRGDIQSKVTYYYKEVYDDVGKNEDPNTDIYVNANRFDIRGVRPIPMIKITSENDLPLLKEYDTSDEWEALIDGYDADFFKTKALFFLTFTEGSGSISHTIGSVNVSDNTFWTVIDQHVPEHGTDDIKDWIILMEIDLAAIEGCSVFDAWMD